MASSVVAPCGAGAWLVVMRAGDGGVTVVVRCRWLSGRGLDDDNAMVIGYGWGVADPMTFEVKFHAQKVEIYASAPLWARLLLTAKKKELLKQEIQSILSGTGFVTGENDDSQQARYHLNG